MQLRVTGAVTYGWGMVPVRGQVGRTDSSTSLWPKDRTYDVPLTVAVRRAEGFDVGDVSTVDLSAVGL